MFERNSGIKPHCSTQLASAVIRTLSTISSFRIRTKSLLVLITLVVATNAAADTGQNWWDGPRVVDSESPVNRGPNISAHAQTNSIDPLVHTSTVSGGGYSGMAQRIGSSLIDPAYMPGSASIATIGGGYDNLNNQLAGTISGGAHHVLFGDGDHGSVGGGSWNMIVEGSYSTIAGGTYNRVSNTGAVIGGGTYNILEGGYGVISGGHGNYLLGDTSGIGSGRDNSVYAPNSFAAGRELNILEHALGSAAFGYQVEVTAPGSLNISGRGAVGQSILVNMNNRTFDSQAVYLLGSGTWTTPKIPKNSVWSGEFHITVASASGQVSALTVNFAATADRIVSTTVDTTVDELGVTPPTLTLNNRRILVSVNGVAGHSLTWNATGTISQANL
jgi:hypothetical protein